MPAKMPVTAMLCVLFAVCAAQGQDKPARTSADTEHDKSILCPVTEQPIDRNVCTRFRDRWVYFTTEAALKKFEADPFEYADNVLVQWEADPPLRVQIKCPVTGETPSSSIYIGKGDHAVFFADEKAKQKWLADAKPYQKRLAQECYTYQTLCAHSQLPINPAVSRSYKHRTLYFMCPNCAAAFDHDSAEEQTRLVKQTDELIRMNERRWKQRQQQLQTGAAENAKQKPTEAQSVSQTNPS